MTIKCSSEQFYSESTKFKKMVYLHLFIKYNEKKYINLYNYRPLSKIAIIKLNLASDISDIFVII